jgi:preprotein translocase subunit SecY
MVSMSPELVRRVALTLGALLVYVLGSDIPIPGFDPAALKQLFWGPGPEVLFDMW